MGIESFSRRTILGERLAKERFKKAQPIVLAGFKGRHFEDLTSRQIQILTILYPPNNPPEENSTEKGSAVIVSYEQCGKYLGVSKQSVEQSHNSAVRRLARGINGLPPAQEDNKGKNNGAHKLEMNAQERKYILKHRDSSAAAISKAIRRSEEIIGRWFDELGIPRKPVGRHPRKKSQFSSY